MKVKIIITVLFILVFSFSCKKETSVIDVKESESLRTYLEENICNKDIFDCSDSSFYFVYIRVRHCGCVQDNIKYLTKRLNLNENEKFIILVRPDKEYNYYKNEIEQFKLLESKNHIISLDLNDNFSKSGNFYISDKIFTVKNLSIVDKIELKKENYNKIIKI